MVGGGVTQKDSYRQAVETLQEVSKTSFSLPDTAADPAVYILTGALPLEGVIHKRALTLFDNMCRLGEGTIEKQLARRQRIVKRFEGNCWYVAVRKLLVKCKFQDCWDIVENLISNFKWKRMVNSQVEEYWANEIRQKASLFSSHRRLPTGEEALVNTTYT